MTEVKIYTTSYCPYCKRAKQLLDSKDVKYEEIDVEHDQKLFEELQKKTHMMTVPQIFINGKLIGGCDDLHALESKGELDRLLSE